MAVADYVAQATLLDDFNRSNEGPPPSSSWAAGSISGATSQLQVVSNAMKRGGAGWGSAYWGTSIAADQICVLTIATVGDFAIHMRIAQPGAGGTYDSYEFIYTSASHTFGIERYLNASGQGDLGTSTAKTLTNGDKVATMCLGSTIALAVYQSGAWSSDVISVTDANLGTGGYIGVWGNGTTPVFDDFSAGEIVVASSVKKMMLLGCG